MGSQGRRPVGGVEAEEQPDEDGDADGEGDRRGHDDRVDADDGEVAASEADGDAEDSESRS